jgi:hypothetical protein
MTHAQLALTCAGPVLIEFLSAAKTMLSFKLQMTSVLSLSMRAARA